MKEVGLEKILLVMCKCIYFAVSLMPLILSMILVISY